MQMTCPKCRGDMHQYERNGVTVDQCTECRGIFLDRGELERLADAEKAYHAAPTPQPGYQQPSSPPQSGYQGGYQQHGGYQQGHHQPHKKKHDSFFEDLFG